jgi:GH24 family phage-related lysozyme (muramidase)
MTTANGTTTARRPAKTIAAAGVSLAALTVWIAAENLRLEPYIPTQGDVPTIAAGVTRYEDGTPVTLNDPPLTRARALELSRSVLEAHARQCAAAIPEVRLSDVEFDLYCADFAGQFGIGNWEKSSMRRLLLAGNETVEKRVAACDALLAWRNQAGRDCSNPKNWGPRGCKGVWTRQVARHARCVEAAKK